MSNKHDYYGTSYNKKHYILSDKNILKQLTRDTFMVDYYKSHPEDFENPQHNLKGIDISKYVLRPKLYGASGIIFYQTKHVIY